MKERHTPQELVDRLAQAGALPAGVALDRGQAEVIGSPLGSALVLAGAGSGKTFVMALRVVYLVANGLVAPEQILGLTFTRKAAAELGDRISWMLSHLPAEMAGGEDAGQPVTSTYNAYAAGIVRDHGLQLGVDPDARVLTEAQKWELGSQVVEAWDGVEHLPDAVPPRPGAPPVGGILAGPPPWPAASTLTRELLTLADQCSDNRVGGEAFAAEVTRIIEGLTRRRDPVLAVGGKRKISATPQVAKQAAGHLAKQLWAGQLISAYTLRKTEAGVMDFADQVAAAKRIAELEGGSAAKAESAVYKAVLLDEFQDTSVLQIEFLRALFGQTAVMAVGDPNQAIYGWRGASVGAMPRFVDSFRGPPGVAGPAVFTLNTARRNDRAILAAANRIVEPLRAELAALLGRRLGGDKPFELPALAPRAEAGPGDIRSAYFATDVEEADYVAQYLREEWLGAGAAAGGAGAGSGPTGRTACVLVRARDQIPEIVRALEDARVPYRVAQSTGLLDVPEIRDLVSALIAGHDLDRGDAFMRLAASPRWGIGIADLDALRRAAAQRRDDSDPPGPLDLVDELAAGSRAALVPQLSEAGALRLADLGRALRRIRSASSRLTLPETVLAAERALNLDIDLLARDGTAGRSQVNRLVQEAHRYAQGQERATLAGFLGWLEQEEQVGDGLAQAEIAGGLSEVEIMTIHAAKGLERDVVVVPGLAEGRLPSCAPGPDGERRARAWLSSQKQSGGTGGLPWSLRLDRADLPQFEPGEAGDVIELRAACEEFLLRAGQHALTEDRRLMYVALTRAKTHLLLTGAWGAGARKGVREPSVFLSELAQESNGEPALLDSAGWAEPPAPADAGSGGVAGALDQPAPDAVAPGPAVPSLDAAGSATDAGSGGVAGALEQPAPDAVAPGSAVPSLDAAGSATDAGSGGVAGALDQPAPDAVAP
ncbi:MAG: UvrD-helicase domain-containing protein, partial [Bifidobacteriaceae bacterium]|nr:UvrD-helicase domain-containing protein [Bifidobacteriaceae bacterium]